MTFAFIMIIAMVQEVIIKTLYNESLFSNSVDIYSLIFMI